MKKVIQYVSFMVIVVAIAFSIAYCRSAGSNGGDNDQALYEDLDLGPFSPAYTELQVFNDITAVELVADIKIGWNLGNTLDANPWSGFFAQNPNPTVNQLETLWVKHVTTEANIIALKNAGFDTIRIPVSWAKAANSDYVIRADWMRRVTEIVNYAIENDMYVILNTHHDEEIFKFQDDDMIESLRAFNRIWKQIASQFKNYSEKLIFEALNEPRTKGSTNEWRGGTPVERDNVNRYYREFINVIRNSGGNNDKRFLMITTYAASAEASAMNGLVLPNDTADSKLIVSIHAYTPYDFALNVNSPVNTWNRDRSSDTSPIINIFDRAYNIFVSKGIPVIMGEFGAMNKNNEEARAGWAEFYVNYARSRGIPCIWWDNGAFTGNGELFGLINRTNNAFTYPLVLEGLMKGAGVR